MTEKIISSIKNAEKEANEIMESQKKQNLEGLDDALALSKDSINKANAAQQASIKESLMRADKDAEAQIDTLKEEYEAKNDKLLEIANNKLADTVKFILTRI